MRRGFLHSWFLWLSLSMAAPMLAQISSEQTEFFEKKIRPVLAEKCYACHGPNLAKPMGGLRLDTRDGARKGGDSGPAIAPGDPDSSVLVKAISYRNIE